LIINEVIIQNVTRGHKTTSINDPFTMPIHITLQMLNNLLNIILIISVNATAGKNDKCEWIVHLILENY